ncbi:unnamed protein product [Gemmata massiliana]|uniref:Uncharacterized protein n=1 Tax=Gemmata massiliana TaxID=1210884 RepID=A0A6P2CZ64_9BACT|nr:hypothetical protein [Gemmata massiliana]VTR93094.1 unnamed protein product [Gemmata massiliana]
MMRTRLLLALLLSLGGASSLCGQDESLKKKIEQSWSHQREEIASAKVRYKIIRTGIGQVLPISSNELLEIIGSNGCETKQQAAGLLSRVTNLKASGDGWFDEGKFVMLGSKRKNSLSGQLNETMVDNADYKVTYSAPNRQVDLEHSSQSSTTTVSLRDFRVVPAEPTGKGVSIRSDKSTYIECNIGEDLLSLDKGSYAVRDYQRVAGGKVTQLFVQRGFQKRLGGVEFPTVSIQSHFKSNQLIYLQVVCVEQAEFNGDVEESEFRISPSPSVNIVDRRNPSPKVISHESPTDMSIEDVVQGANEPHQAVRKYGFSSTSRIYLAIAGVLCLLLGVAIYFLRVRLRGKVGNSIGRLPSSN